MKCLILWHLIWVLTVCTSTHLYIFFNYYILDFFLNGLHWFLNHIQKMLQQIWWIGLNQKYHIDMRITRILLTYDRLQQDSKI